MKQSSISTALVLTVAGLLSAAASGQQNSTDALKGPAVQDRAVPGAVGQFSGSDGKEKGKFAQREVRPQVFMESLMKALGPDAPEDVRASDQLREQLRTMGAEYRKQVAAYTAEHKDELAKIKKAEAKRNKNSGEAGADPQAKPDAEMQEMAEKGRALREGMPSASDFYTKVWTLLSDKQRAAVETRLEEFKHDQDVKEGKQYVARKLKKAEPVPGQVDGLAKQKGKFAGVPAKAAAPEKSDTPAGAKISPEIRARFEKLMALLTPEEREQLMTRLEERVRDRAGDGARQRGSKREDPKPAPSTKDISIPKPE